MRLSILTCLALLFWTCTGNQDPVTEMEYVMLQGETMGTYYRVTYAHPQSSNLQQDIEALLLEVNMELSTYIDSSIISRFNQAERDWKVKSQKHILTNLEAAGEVYLKSGGAFDPTVMPLVNYWGFGYTEKKAVTSVDSLRVDSLKNFIGYDKIIWEGLNGGLQMTKANPGVQLDFSACAKGYGVDAVGELLETKGVAHYLVDIGGEIKVKGKSPRGDKWNIGINTPLETADLLDVQETIPITDLAVATSGPYRNFYEIEGIKYSHTINPVTGYPQRNTLLSVSVFTKQCMIADAFATAFLVMGMEKALELASSLQDLEVYCIYGKTDGTMGAKYTDGLKPYFDKALQ